MIRRSTCTGALACLLTALAAPRLAHAQALRITAAAQATPELLPDRDLLLAALRAHLIASPVARAAWPTSEPAADDAEHARVQSALQTLTAAVDALHELELKRAKKLAGEARELLWATATVHRDPELLVRAELVAAALALLSKEGAEARLAVAQAAALSPGVTPPADLFNPTMRAKFVDAAEAAGKETGTLEVTTSAVDGVGATAAAPRGAVFIDDVLIGMTPLESPPLVAGRHLVRVVGPYGVDSMSVVTIAKGARAHLAASLPPVSTAELAAADTGHREAARELSQLVRASSSDLVAALGLEPKSTTSVTLRVAWYEAKTSRWLGATPLEVELDALRRDPFAQVTRIVQTLWQPSKRVLVSAEGDSADAKRIAETLVASVTWMGASLETLPVAPTDACALSTDCMSQLVASSKVELVFRATPHRDGFARGVTLAGFDSKASSWTHAKTLTWDKLDGEALLRMTGELARALMPQPRELATSEPVHQPFEPGTALGTFAVAEKPTRRGLWWLVGGASAATVGLAATAYSATVLGDRGSTGSAKESAILLGRIGLGVLGIGAAAFGYGLFSMLDDATPASDAATRSATTGAGSAVRATR